MHDVSQEGREPAELLEEIDRLQREVARLEGRLSELDRLAHEDTLVPLANRRGLTRELEIMIARVARHGERAAVLFIDLDGLKVLNDSFGHEGGDAALRQVAKELRAGTRATDCVARLGGDEFCILLAHADEANALDTAERLVNNIVNEDFIYRGAPMPLSIAIGVTMVESGDTPEIVLARADRAMYRAKAAA